MKKKEYLYVIVSVIFFILGGVFCFKAINSTKKSVFSGANTHVSTKKIILRVMVQDK